MTNVRTTVSDAKRRGRSDDVVFTDAPPDGHEWKLSEAAAQIGVNRVTLLRWDQKGTPIRARWRRKPMAHRVYNAFEIKVIKDWWDAKVAAQDETRNFVEDTNAPT